MRFKLLMSHTKFTNGREDQRESRKAKAIYREFLGY